MTKTDQSECRIVLGVAHLYAGQKEEVVRVLGEGEGEGEGPGLFQEMVFYMRGVASLSLGETRSGMVDINRSLVLNSQSYRVSVSIHGLVHVLSSPNRPS